MTTQNYLGLARPNTRKHVMPAQRLSPTIETELGDHISNKPTVDSYISSETDQQSGTLAWNNQNVTLSWVLYDLSASPDILNIKFIKWRKPFGDNWGWILGGSS